MRLKLQVRRAGDVAVLECEGMIVSGPEAEHLEEKVNWELTEGSKHLVMELGAISRVDSAGLGLMVRLMTRARKAGGDLKLASPPAFVGNLLQMTRLATLFQVFHSEQEAVLSYRGPKPQIPKPEPGAGMRAILPQP
jgi:anti-anti-sigma factor